MKRYGIFLVILSFLFLGACGGGGGGGDGDQGSPEENLSPIADAGVDQSVIENDIVTLDGTNSSDPEENPLTFSWVQIDVPSVTLSDVTAEQPTFTAPEVEDASITLTFELTVSDGKKSAVDICTVTVLNRAVLDTQEQAEDVLFAAYAGIGYMDAGISGDEENLYRVMLDDFNALTGDLIYKTLFGDPQYMSKLLGLVSGFNTTLNYTDIDGNECSLEIYPGKLDLLTGRRPFSATLSVSFSSSGYSLSDCIYTGEDETCDFSGTFSGYFKAILQAPYLEEFFIKSIELEAKETLTATYPFGIGIVLYDGWRLSCDIYYGEDDPEYEPGDLLNPVNVVFDPINWSSLSYDVDFRDYTVGGSFSVNDEIYTFGDGFHYQQKEYYSLTMIFIDGNLMVPGTDGFIDVDTPDDYWENPEENGTIIRDDNGIWTSGNMYLDDDIVEITFYEDGSTDFDAYRAIPLWDEFWSVVDWQDTLDPF